MMPSPPSVAGELPALRTGGGEGRKGQKERGEEGGEGRRKSTINMYVASSNTYIWVHMLRIRISPV